MYTEGLIRRHTDVFTDMPGETDMIQHRVKLKDNTQIRCKSYPFAVCYEGRAMEWSGQYAWDGRDETINVALRVAHRHG